MPVEVVGLKEAIVAMRKLQPDLERNLKIEIKEVLKPIVKKAKGYAPADISGLSSWTFKARSGKINAKTSGFRVGHFPLYNVNQVRAGIKSEIFPTKANTRGFISLVRIVNQTAAGAIFETAGRKNPGGQPWNKNSKSHRYSHSNNPDAGLHFINSMGATMQGSGKFRGRLIYRAWHEDQGRALAAIMKALQKTSNQSVRYVNAAKAFKKAA